jgi:hypothetical protein
MAVDIDEIAIARLRRDEVLTEARRLSPYNLVFALARLWYVVWTIEGEQSVRTILRRAHRRVTCLSASVVIDDLQDGKGERLAAQLGSKAATNTAMSARKETSKPMAQRNALTDLIPWARRSALRQPQGHRGAAVFQTDRNR